MGAKAIYTSLMSIKFLSLRRVPIASKFCKLRGINGALDGLWDMKTRSSMQIVLVVGGSRRFIAQPHFPCWGIKRSPSHKCWYNTRGYYYNFLKCVYIMNQVFMLCWFGLRLLSCKNYNVLNVSEWWYLMSCQAFPLRLYIFSKIVHKNIMQY